MAICIIEHLNSILEIHEVKSKEENDSVDKQKIWLT